MSETQVLLEMISRAYNRRSWHGTSLRGSIRGLSVAEAAWRPGAGRHNVWELVLHAAYWKYVVWRRLSGSPRGTFPLEGSNWFNPGDPRNAELWKDHVSLLNRTHHLLYEAVGKLPPRDLHRRVPRGSATNFELIIGVAAHDLYHAGQIQLLKRLHRER